MARSAVVVSASSGFFLYGDFSLSFRLGWTGKDLKSGSPYNPYRIRGLPPGPICNPGLASLRAALYPARVPYLYFVSKNDGSHLFSMRLGEHNQAVKIYQSGKPRHPRP